MKEQSGNALPTENAGAEYKYMGIFDFLSSPTLDEQLSSVLSSHIKKNKSVIKKLSAIQQDLLHEIKPEEKILLITFNDIPHWHGFIIITNERVIRFDSELEQGLAYTEIESIELPVRASGQILIRIVGREALPYKSYKGSEMDENVRDIWVKNTVHIDLPSHQIQKQISNILYDAADKKIKST